MPNGLRTLLRLRLSVLAILLSAVTVLNSIVAEESLAVRLAVTPEPVFDGFYGPLGSFPNPLYWTNDPASTTGWANGEVANYTDSPENVFLDGQGHLVIQALSASDGYTTSRINTLGKLEMIHGKVEARIKLPAGHAIWPTFYLMGTNCRKVGWPDCGELDIAELVSDYTNFHVTLHGPQKGNPRGYEIAAWDPSATDVTEDFHIYWAERRPSYIQVGIDNTALGTFTPDLLPENSQWVFEAPMYATLGLAIGNKYSGPPNSSTPFPSQMIVDWFRYTP